MKNKNSSYTVAELIEILKQFPADLSVLVSGYEDGFENILEPEKITLLHKADNPYWSGEFQEIEQQDSENSLEAVVLRRMVRND